MLRISISKILLLCIITTNFYGYTIGTEEVDKSKIFTIKDSFAAKNRTSEIEILEEYERNKKEYFLYMIGIPSNNVKKKANMAKTKMDLLRKKMEKLNPQIALEKMDGKKIQDFKQRMEDISKFSPEKKEKRRIELEEKIEIVSNEIKKLEEERISLLRDFSYEKEKYEHIFGSEGKVADEWHTQKEEEWKELARTKNIEIGHNLENYKYLKEELDALNYGEIDCENDFFKDYFLEEK